MSGRDWQWPLEAGETLLWQGRPAPRCYTFRHWMQAAIGTLLFLASSFWLMLAYQLIKSEAYPWWLVMIPGPLVVLSFWFGPLALPVARLRWEKVFYALTENRLLIRDGLFSARMCFFPLSEVEDWQQKKFSAQLISLRLLLKSRKSVILHCLEQPSNLLMHLQREVKKPVRQDDSV